MNFENNEESEDIINLDEPVKKEKSLEETIEINFNENANIIEPQKVEIEYIKTPEIGKESIVKLENEPQNIQKVPDNSINNFGVEPEDDFRDVKNGNNIVWIAIIIFVILFAGGFFAWKYLLLTPKQLLFHSIGTYQKNIMKELEEHPFSNFNSRKLISKIEIDSNKAEGSDALNDFLGDLSFDVTSLIDQENKRMEFNFDAKIKEEKSLSVSGYYSDNILYVLSEDIFKKYISFPYKELGSALSSEELTMEELKYLIEVVNKSLMSSFNEDNFKKTKEEVNLNGKNLKTTKVSYEFKNSEIDKIFEKVLEDILKDDKSVEILAALESTTKEEMKQTLKDSLDEIDSSENFKERKLEIISYNKGILNQPVKMEFNFYSIDKEDFETIIKLDIQNYEKITKINLDSQDVNILNLVADKTDSKKIKVNLSFEDSSSDCEFIIDNSKEETIYSYDFKSTPANFRMNGDFKFTLTEKEKDKKYNEVFLINVDFGTLNKVSNSIKININSEIILNEPIEKKDILNSVEVSSLTEQEVITIFENIYKNPFIIELFDHIIQDFISSEI